MMAFLEYSPTRPLYHYTSIGAFENILRTGCFWLSDLQASNDPREFHLPKQGIIEAIKRFDPRYIPELSVDFIDLILNRLEFSLQKQRIYSLCFTPRRDDLHFWREYGNDGSGLCFSVRPRALRDMCVRIQRVTYIDTKDVSYFDNIVEVQFDKLRFVRDNLDLLDELEIIVAFLSAIYSTKHSSWSLEDEVRLTFASSDRDDASAGIPLTCFPDGSEMPYRPPSQREGVDGMIGYYELPFGRYEQGKYDHTRSIADVILGPRSAKDAAYINQMLKDYGIKDCTLVNSECCFR